MGRLPSGSPCRLRGVPAISPSVQVTVDVQGNDYTYDVDPDSCTVGNILSLAGLSEVGEIYGVATDALDVNDVISGMEPTAREGNRLVRHSRFCITLSKRCWHFCR